jgi:tetratricopeptide (TPR) repeat protein
MKSWTGMLWRAELVMLIVILVLLSSGAFKATRSLLVSNQLPVSNRLAATISFRKSKLYLWRKAGTFVVDGRSKVGPHIPFNARHTGFEMHSNMLAASIAEEENEMTFDETMEYLHDYAGDLTPSEVRLFLLPWTEHVTDLWAFENDHLQRLLTTAMSWRLTDVVSSLVDKYLEWSNDKLFMTSRQFPDIRQIIEFFMSNDGFTYALHTVDILIAKRVKVKRTIFLSLLQGAGNADNVMQVLRRMRKSSVDVNVELFSAVVKFVDWKSSLKLLDLVEIFGCEANEPLYSAVIELVAQANRMDIALDLVHRMKLKGITPSYDCYSHLVVGCARNNMWRKMNTLLEEIVYNHRYLLSEHTLRNIISHIKHVQINPNTTILSDARKNSLAMSGFSLTSPLEDVSEKEEQNELSIIGNPGQMALNLIRKYGNHTKHFFSYSVFTLAIEIAESRNEWKTAYDIYEEMIRLLNNSKPPIHLLSKLIRVSSNLNNSVLAANLVRDARGYGIDIPIMYQETLDCCFNTGNVEDALELLNYKVSQINDTTLLTEQVFGLDRIAAFISLGLQKVANDYQDLIVSASDVDADNSKVGGILIPQSRTIIATHGISQLPRKPITNNLVNLMRHLFVTDITYAKAISPMINLVNYLLLECGEYDLVRMILQFYLNSAQPAPLGTNKRWKKTTKKAIAFPTSVDAVQLSHVYENATQYLVRLLQRESAKSTNFTHYINAKNILHNISMSDVDVKPGNTTRVLEVLGTWLRDVVTMKELKLAGSLLRQCIRGLTNSFQDVSNKDVFLKRANSSFPSKMPWEMRRTEIMNTYQQRQVIAKSNGKLLYAFIKDSHDVLFEHDCFPNKIYQIAVLIFTKIEAYDEILDLYNMAASDAAILKRKTYHLPSPTETGELFLPVVQACVLSPNSSQRALELLNNELNIVTTKVTNRILNKNEISNGKYLSVLFPLAIQASRQVNDSQGALKYYQRMLQNGLQPDHFTMKQLLHALAVGQQPSKQLEDAVTAMKTFGLPLDEEVYRLLTVCYLREEKIDEAMLSFDTLTRIKLKLPENFHLLPIKPLEEVSKDLVKRSGNRKLKKKEATKIQKRKESEDTDDEGGVFDEDIATKLQQQLEYEEMFSPQHIENRNMYKLLVDKLHAHQRFEDMDNVYLQALSEGMFHPFKALKRGSVDLFDHDSLPLMHANVRLLLKAAQDTFQDSLYVRRNFCNHLRASFAQFRSSFNWKRESRSTAIQVDTMEEWLHIRTKPNIAPLDGILEIFSATLRLSLEDITSESTKENFILSLPHSKLVPKE